MGSSPGANDLISRWFREGFWASQRTKAQNSVFFLHEQTPTRTGSLDRENSFRITNDRTHYHRGGLFSGLATVPIAGPR